MQCNQLDGLWQIERFGKRFGYRTSPMPLAQSPDSDDPRDVVTGLPGPESVSHRLAEWSSCNESGAFVHALLIGFRRFDAINHAYGEAAVEAALAEVASRIWQFAGQEFDGPFLAARGGGATFLLIAPEVCSRERWQLLAEQLADVLSRPIPLPSGILRLSPRGALLRGTIGETAGSLLDRLDQTLAQVMRHQGRRLAWADGEVVRTGRSSAQMESDILRAIDNDEIEVLYQPQFRLADDRLSGAEALARWNHPKLGRIGAAALFAIAERTDHIAPLSRHIAQLAFEGACHWPQSLRLSLNVTPTDLAVARFGDDIMAIANNVGFPLSRLTLEVTEQALLGDIQLAARTFDGLTRHGVRIALDDFGAGFCNFRYLKLLPLHYLKLDRSMIDGVTGDRRDLAVFRAIVAMAHALDLEVIAEGVEHEAQRELIATEGCAFYQGFLRAQPMTAREFSELASD